MYYNMYLNHLANSLQMNNLKQNITVVLFVETSLQKQIQTIYKVFATTIYLCDIPKPLL